MNWLLAGLLCAVAGLIAFLIWAGDVMCLWQNADYEDEP